MHLLLALDNDRQYRARSLFLDQPFRVDLDFHGVRARLATNSLYLAGHVRLGYGHFESSIEREPDVSLLALEAGEENFEDCFKTLLPGRSGSDHVVALLDGELIYLLRDRPPLAYYTTMNLFSAVISRLRKRYACVHAATVSLEGKAAILCGAARCGKTSLTANLLARGLDYSSDDVTLLERENLLVAAFPRALNVRMEGGEVSASLLAGARRAGRFRIADQERLIIDLGRPVPDTVEPAAICFPRFTPEGPAVLMPLGKAEALAGLMQNRFHPMGGRPDPTVAADFDALGRLADGCGCYVLTFSDPAEGARLVAGELLGESRQQ